MIQNNIIGITGTIGSGKTTAAHIMETLGAYVINADIVAREILLPGAEAAHKIREAFGDDVMLSHTDVIDRKKLAERIFSDAEARKTLDSITLPLIKQEMYRQAETAHRVYKHEIIVFDAPLLIESGLHEGLRDVWLIRADTDVKIKRIMQRDHSTREQALARLSSRVSDDELARYATVIIDNNDSYRSLHKKVCEIWKEKYM